MEGCPLKTPKDIITEAVAQYGFKRGVDAEDPSLDLAKVLDSLALVELIYKIEAHIGKSLDLEQILEGQRLPRSRLESWIERSKSSPPKGR